LKVFRNISLKCYNTFGLDYKAEILIRVDTEEEAVAIIKEGRPWRETIFILGGGSNVLFTGNYNGTIINPLIEDIIIEDRSEGYYIVSAGAGVKWDSFVEWCVNNELYGIENLSLIPGLVGASPIQNIGAYGAEVKDTIYKLRAVEIKSGSVIEFNNRQCQFGYRDSIFKRELKGKYLITRVYFKLNTDPEYNIDYGALRSEVEKLGKVTLGSIRQAVINIRRSKLPDPEITGNAGSFFKNPVLVESEIQQIKKIFPLMPVYPDQKGGGKVPAGWLIDQCGWKGKRYGDAAVHDRQALVIVNYGKATGTELLDLSESIRESVYKKFGILLEREVNVIQPTGISSSG
jgi:UDP-N-acetylmuramate dehydrogenase